jgi:hypothetical protein
MTFKQMFANIAAIAANAYDSTDDADVQSWDAYAAAKQIVEAMQAHGYDVADMLVQLEEDKEWSAETADYNDKGSVHHY